MNQVTVSQRLDARITALAHEIEHACLQNKPSAHLQAEFDEACALRHLRLNPPPRPAFEEKDDVS